MLLLIEGGVYFVGKPAIATTAELGTCGDTDIDAGSSTCSLPVLLSAVETSLRKRTALEITQWALAEIIRTPVCALRVLAEATIWGWRLIEELLYVNQSINHHRITPIGERYKDREHSRNMHMHTHKNTNQCPLCFTSTHAAAVLSKRFVLGAG